MGGPLLVCPDCRHSHDPEMQCESDCVTCGIAGELVGQRVAYRPHPAAPVEYGEAVEVRGGYVMVRYDGDTGAKATRPADLEPVEAEVG